jgi:7-cyano-7-deazaguanine synthase in queuosine biosynthesis
MRRKPTGRNSNKTFAPSPPNDKILKELGSSADLSGINAFIIGSSIFETEQRLRLGQVDRVIIPLYQANKTTYDLRAISKLIHELLIFTVVEDIEIEFRPMKTQLSLNYPSPECSIRSVCLFSGGTDSYAGVLLAKEVLGDIKSVFCAHGDQARIIRIVQDLRRKILERKGIDLVKIGVPKIEAKGYAQLRGFLYLLAATAVAHQFGSEQIVVTECGPTMYQPKFSPLDSVTMTTHPFVVRTAAQVARLLLHRELNIITPFENLTKAEVIAISPEKQGLKHTHSCITQRFGTHDGTCYGCVIRRLATIATGVEDVRYNKNPISDSKARAGNLYALLSFCREILTSFDEMEEYEAGLIHTYGKRDLFGRFALDNFAAIHRLLSDN